MQIIKLDLSDYEVPVNVVAKQGDVGRKFQAQIYDNGKEYLIPDGAMLSVWYSGTSGCGNYSMIGERSAFSVEGNAVTVELITQMLSNKGGGALCLVLNGADGTQIAMWNIAYIVEPVPGMDSQGATEYFTALTEAVKKAQDAAQMVDKTLAGKLSVGLYSRDEFWVDSREDQKTAKFWDQIIAIYDDMAVGTVELVNGIVVSSFGSVDPNEPPGGNYRVTITKSRDAKWGFVEAESYHADAWGGPNRITRLNRDGKWQNAVNVSANIYEHVRREILWENASPASPLTGTLISLKDTVTKYNALLILVNMDTNLHYTIPVLIKYGGSSNGGVAYFPTNSTQFDTVGRNNWSTLWRYFWWQSSKLKVKLDNLNGSETSFGATKCVPVRIYGLNL